VLAYEILPQIDAGCAMIEVFMSMMSFGELTPLFVVGFIVIAILVTIWGYQQAKKRREEMAAWARSMGLSFSARKDRHMDDRFREFSCLQEGHSRYAENVVEGRIGDRNIIAFDYHYTTGSGKSTTHHHISPVILDVDLPLKPLSIRPEHVFDKVTEMLGFDDIDFELNEFSSRFYVKSLDRKWAYDVIHQATMEFLLASPTFHLQFSGRHVIAYRNKAFTIADFTAAIAVIEGMIDRLPEYLIRELKGHDR
jgi:hypothetical protein